MLQSVFWSNDSFDRVGSKIKQAARVFFSVGVCVNLKWGPNWNQLFRWDSAGMRPEYHNSLTRTEREAGGVDKRIWISRRASASFPLLTGDNLVLFVLCSSFRVDVTGNSVTEEDCGNAAAAETLQMDKIRSLCTLMPSQTYLYPYIVLTHILVHYMSWCW